MCTSMGACGIFQCFTLRRFESCDPLSQLRLRLSLQDDTSITGIELKAESTFLLESWPDATQQNTNLFAFLHTP